MGMLFPSLSFRAGMGVSMLAMVRILLDVVGMRMAVLQRLRNVRVVGRSNIIGRWKDCGARSSG